ncbi:MAG: GbsR/MarR family transcriptional regulator [Pseudomonadota bacterium]
MKDLEPSKQAFVLHFGEMGSRWGINRTVGQIYALLYMSEQPLNAEQITEELGLSRSNVSMGIKELHAWHLIRAQHLPGDRKDYFSTPGDVLDIALILLEERRKRELEPTLTLLRQMLMDDSEHEASHPSFERDRMREMHDLMEQVSDWADDLQRISRKDLKLLLNLSKKVPRLLEMKDKVTSFGKRD